MKLAKLWTNNQEIETETHFETLNSATGEANAEVCAAGPNDVTATVKEGGWGRNLSHHGLHEMTNVKSIVSTDSQEHVWWYPYNKQKLMNTKMYYEMNFKASP